MAGVITLPPILHIINDFLTNKVGPSSDLEAD